MKKFIAGVPVVTFINCQTKEEVKMMFTMDYSKYGDEIDIDYAVVCEEEYQTVLGWLMDECFVKVRLEFNTYNGDTENIVASKSDTYIETYPVIMIYKPFVKSSNAQSAGTIEFKIKVRE